MSSPVILSDLEARWRPLTTAEAVRAQALLDDAWAILLTVYPSVDTTVWATNPVRSQVVRAAVCAMVLRVLKNPDGKISETIGNYSYMVATASASAGLFVASGEMRLVQQAFGFGGGVYSVRMTTPADTAWPYVATA